MERLASLMSDKDEAWLQLSTPSGRRACACAIQARYEAHGDEGWGG